MRENNPILTTENIDKRTNVWVNLESIMTRHRKKKSIPGMTLSFI